MKFYLGSHIAHWLWTYEHNFCVSRRRLYKRKTYGKALKKWFLDSGGFTELSLNGKWTISPGAYVKEIYRYQDEIGKLAFCAQQDWMCESEILEKTGKSLVDHQELTVENMVKLLSIDDSLPWIPVLQGITLDDYLRCWEKFHSRGIDLSSFSLVGLGSVCRRQHTSETENIIRRLHSEGLSIHAFGMKKNGIKNCFNILTSSDSMSWSLQARFKKPLPGCTHKKCNNCKRRNAYYDY